MQLGLSTFGHAILMDHCRAGWLLTAMPLDVTKLQQPHPRRRHQQQQEPQQRQQSSRRWPLNTRPARRQTLAAAAASAARSATRCTHCGCFRSASRRQMDGCRCAFPAARKCMLGGGPAKPGDMTWELMLCMLPSSPCLPAKSNTHCQDHRRHNRLGA
jgi:hypothetical protein